MRRVKRHIVSSRGHISSIRNKLTEAMRYANRRFRTIISDLFSFSAPLTNSIIPDIGTLSNFSRDGSGEATITDFEGLVKNTLAQEARFKGARRVENLFNEQDTRTDIATDIEWVKGGTSSYLSDGEWFCADGAGNSISIGNPNRITASVGQTYTISAEVFSSDVTSLKIGFYDTADRMSGVVDASALVGRRISFTGTTAVGTTFIYPQFFADGDSGNTKLINWQAELVEGQANQNPSEYVSVGVGTSSELNSNVDINNEDNWFLTLGCDYLNSRIEVDSTVGNNVICSELDNIPVVGRPYLVSVTIENWVSVGTVVSSTFGGSVLNFAFDGDGVFHAVVYPVNSVSGLSIAITTSPSVFNITKLSVKEIAHGSNVDGVKYFEHENGNTVASNIVTEGRGNDIADSVLEGVLVEESSENLIEESQDINNAWWAVSNAQIDTADTINIGAEEVYRLEDDATLGTVQHRIYKALTPTTNGAVTMQCIVKKGDKQFVIAQEYGDGAQRFSTFNLDTGAWESIHANHSVGQTEIQTGVYFIWCSTTWTTGAGRTMAFNLAEVTNNVTYVGTQGEGNYIGALQIAELPYPTSYIPTSGGTATRTKDVLQYTPPDVLTGSAVNDFVITGEITMPFNGVDLGSVRYLLNTANGTYANQVALILDGSTGKLKIRKKIGAPLYDAISNAALIVGSTYKFAGRVSSTQGVHLFLNKDGVPPTVAETTSDSNLADMDLSSSPTNLFIGSTVISSGQNSTPIKDLKIYQGDLSDARCVELTS